MLEILAVILLCKTNKKNAERLGRSSGRYIGLTVGLWILFEIIGAGLGTAFQMGIGTYLLALVFAMAGGALSWIIARIPAPYSEGDKESSIHKLSMPYASNPPAHVPPKNIPLILTAAISAEWVLLLVFHYFFPDLLGNARILYNTKVPILITSVLFGTGVYMLLQKDAASKRLSAAAFGAGIFILTFHDAAYRSIILHSSLLQAYGSGTDAALAGFLRPLANALLPAITASGLALLFDHLWYGRDKRQRIRQIAFIAAGGVFLTEIIKLFLNPSIRLDIMTLRSFIITCTGYLAGSAALVLTVILLHSMCTQKRWSIRLSGWPFIWCILCAAGMFGSLILIFSPNITYSANLIFAAAAMTGFILLLCHRRIGFFVMAASAFITLVSQFLAAMEVMAHQYINYNTLIYSTDRKQYALLLAASVSGALTFAVTWISIQPSWLRDTVESYVDIEKKSARPFSKAAAVTNLVVCSLIYLGAAGTLINGDYSEYLVLLIIFAMAVLCLSICVMPALFCRFIPYRRWMDVSMQILFFLICSVLASVIIVELFHVVFAH